MYKICGPLRPAIVHNEALGYSRAYSGGTYIDLPLGTKLSEVEWVCSFSAKQVITKSITGSKGNSYIVTNCGGVWTCTCPGHKYRKGECKHITLAKNE